MKRLACIVFSVGLLLHCSAIVAQQADSARVERYFLGVTGGLGFLWAHNPGMENMVNDHTICTQISFSKQSVGNRLWERQFHLPQYGCSVLAMNLGDQEKLGYGIALMPFINFPLGVRERKVKFHFYTGFGPGWVTKIFDPETNHQNSAIGSHLNVCIRLRLNARAMIGDKLAVEGGIEMTHFSNGAAKLPNLGINLPALIVSVQYNIFDKPANANHAAMNSGDDGMGEHRWSAAFYLSGGVGALQVASPKRYGACNLLSYFMWQLSPRHRFGGGLDLMWSGGIYERRLNRGDDVMPLNNFQPGVKFCYELVLGRMSWPFEVGAYLYSPYLINGSVYNRLGIRYRLSKHVDIGMAIKANINVAEYWEVYTGWRF